MERTILFAIGALLLAGPALAEDEIKERDRARETATAEQRAANLRCKREASYSPSNWSFWQS
jgi:hypothetical protein